MAIKLAHQWATREQLGLPIKRPIFGTIARGVRQELERSLETDHCNVVCRYYITALDKSYQPDEPPPQHSVD